MHLLAQILAQCTRQPGATAITADTGTLRYDDLDRISRGIAAQLAASGVQSGDQVVLLSDRNLALVLGMMACLRLNAPFVIADRAYPTGRLCAMIEAVDPAALVTCGDPTIPEDLHQALPPATQGRLLHIPSVPEAAFACFAHQDNSTLLDQPPAPDATAYISFTSGSTGKPKAIATGYAPLPHFIAWHRRTHDLSEADRFSAISGLSHDPFLRDVFTPLALGATLCIPTQEILFDPNALATWFSMQQISICHLTPALGELLYAGAEAEALPLANLRGLFFGGDVLARQTLDRLLAIAPNAQAVNFYGATETPQAMGAYRIDPAAAEQRFPLGKGIDDTNLLIVRPDGTLATSGETGEIWIQTRYLSQGYLNDPAQTAERFVAAPDDAKSTDPCYRTGDLGRMLPDGTVLYVGRMDHQLKIRGFRVEPGEISAQIEQVPGVTRALVLGREAAQGMQLVAYVTTQTTDYNTLNESIRTQLAQALPCYMMPTHLVSLAQFPLLPNGKIDLQALPNPSYQPTSATTDDDEPITQQEASLLAIWRDALGMPDIRVTDNFLALGGDSLTALKIMARMKALHIPLPVARGIFQGRSVRELVRGIQQPSGTPAAITPEHRTNLAMNTLRALLLLIVVADHWIDGLANRLLGPEAGQQFVQAMMPLLNLATPGFTFVFGLGVGYITYAKYSISPRQTRQGLYSAGGIVLGGVTIMALLNLVAATAHMPLSDMDSTTFFNAFYGALLYYAVALFTMPLWLYLISATRHAYLACLALIVAFIGLNEFCRWLWLDAEQQGLLQLLRLLLVAKFSYFNMGIGTLAGLGCGLYLKRHTHADLRHPLFMAGLTLVVAGLALLYITTGSLTGIYDSMNMALWRWIFDIGVVLIVSSGLMALYRQLEGLPTRAVTALRGIAAVGLATFPLFVLHSLVIPAKDVLVMTGLSSAQALLLCMAGFFTLTLWLTNRLYQLYFAQTTA